MKLLALLIGILAERYLARWSHLREFRRLDEQANRLAERLMRLDKRTAPYIVAGITLVFAAPIGVVAWLLRDQWQQIPWFVFAVLVLLFPSGRATSRRKRWPITTRRMPAMTTAPGRRPKPSSEQVHRTSRRNRPRPSRKQPI